MSEERRKAVGKAGRPPPLPYGVVTPKAATAGAGAALGGFSGLLIGLAVSTIPGIGPVLAVGPFLGALAGAGLGAVAGAAIGPDYVPPEDLEYFAEAVRRGGTVVAVTGDERMLDVAAEILARYPAIDLEERVMLWRRQGWERFDPSADPLTEAQIHAERAACPPSTGGNVRRYSRRPAA